MEKLSYEELEKRNKELEVKLQNKDIFEKVLKNSQKNFKLLYERTPLPYQSLDESGIFLMVNSSWLNTLGYSKDEVIGKNIIDFLHPEWEDHLESNFSRLKSCGEVSGVQFKMIRKDGKNIIVEVEGRISYDAEGKFQQTHCILQDITERDNKENKLQMEKDKLEKVISESTVGISIYKESGECIMANDFLAQQLGTTKESVLSQNFNNINSWKKINLLEKAKLSLSEFTKSRCDVEVETSYGKLVNFDIHLIPFKSMGEKYLLFMANDVSEYKKLEKEKIHINNQMMQVQKMDSIGSLAGGVAHDYNNILAGILGFAEIIAENLRCGKFNPQNILHKIEKIVSSCMRAKDLTAQLLGFSRQGKYNPKNLNPVKVLKDVIDIVEKQAKVENAQLIHEINSSFYINADEWQLYHVIQNILINSLHSGESKVIVKVSINDMIINNSKNTLTGVMPPGEYVYFCLEDNGSGINKEILSRIFEPFFTTKKKGRGTGMGLAMVYGIVKKHYGYLDVETSTDPSNHGTIFHLYLPAIQKNETISIETKKTDTIRGKILFIDDELILTELVEDALRRKGHEIYVFTDGQEALSQFKEGGFDLIITDLIMPNSISGAELCQEIRKIDTKVALYAISGYHLDAKVRYLLENGVDGFLGKPFQLDSLYKLVEKALTKNK